MNLPLAIPESPGMVFSLFAFSWAWVNSGLSMMPTPPLTRPKVFVFLKSCEGLRAARRCGSRYFPASKFLVGIQRSIHLFSFDG